MKRGTFIALACLLLVFMLFGCTTGGYVPCCVKDGVVNTTTGLVQPNPQCTLPDQTAFGNCDSSLTTMLVNAASSKGLTAACSGDIVCSGKAASECAKLSPSCTWDGACRAAQCADLQGDTCTKTASCSWNESTGSCSGAAAYFVMPVCTDSAPQSCVNNRCTAMMCGYAGSVSGPPPSAQDWNASRGTDQVNAYPQSLLEGAPAINLQGTSCSFETMNRKLYDSVTKGKGSLWVNSFRFGLGQSFSDYEASKYFFPVSDRACSINPSGTIDRFTVYVNEPATYCQDRTQQFFTCTENNQSFTDRNTCLAYCNGDQADCQPSVSSKFVCLQDNFAYGSELACRNSCAIVQDPTLCSNDPATSPYLEPDARYRMKYVSDYNVHTIYTQDNSDKDHLAGAVCRSKAARDGSVETCLYEADNYACNDYAPSSGGICPQSWVPPADGPWFTWENDGVMKTYYESHKYATTDFDYEYYASKLVADQAAAGADPNQAYPFECKDGGQCISGSCDTTHYKRGLCATTGGSTVDCGCTVERYGQTQTLTAVCKEIPSGTWSARQGSFNGVPSIVANPVADAMFLDSDIYSETGSTKAFKYYVPAGQQLKLFSACGVAKTTVSACINAEFRYEGTIPAEFLGYSITEGGSAGTCGSYDRYDIAFNSAASSSSLGACNVDTPGERPYLDIGNMGWCAGCTYATMAVQQVDWSKWTNAKYCYEWRGDANYTVVDGPGTVLRDFNNDGKSDASVADVRKFGDGDALNGNIERGPWQDNFYYTCVDDWNSENNGEHGWWPGGTMPEPSAPYLRDKLTTYLQSNIMPILDEQGAATGAKYGTVTIPAACTFTLNAAQYYCSGSNAGPYATSNCNDACGLFSSCSQGWMCVSTGQRGARQDLCDSSCPYPETCVPAAADGYACNNNGKIYSSQATCESGVGSCPSRQELQPTGIEYRPVDICRNNFGDGAVLHVVGNVSMLNDAGLDKGQVASVAGSTSNLVSYLSLNGDAVETAPGSQIYNLKGMAAITARANALKDQCPSEPLVGLEIDGYYDRSLTESEPIMDQLIGADGNSPAGTLHRFFYKPNFDGAVGEGSYEQMVARGTPNVYSGKVDILMQQWYPRCDSGSTPLESVQREFDARMGFSRSLLSNFSRPSIIWKFHFPAGSLCDQPMFMEYLFNNTGVMVDSGVVGLIYDSWMTESGKGYGDETRLTVSTGVETQPTYTGLTTGIAEGALDLGPVGAGGAGTTGTPFCAVQQKSQKLLGVTKFTYGQKLLATDNTCTCEACSETDYLLGLCDSTANPAGNDDLPQLVCNDGNRCTMPSGITNSNAYKCSNTCVNSVSCTLCSDPSFANAASFCRIEETGSQPTGATKNYSEFSDVNWEWLAGLPAQSKCCLVSQQQNFPTVEYTYVKREGQKTRQEFIQYPTRGELGIDCGRTPDTSILKYCNIVIPVSQRQFTCTPVVN